MGVTVRWSGGFSPEHCAVTTDPPAPGLHIRHSDSKTLRGTIQRPKGLGVCEKDHERCTRQP
jgi:hypothetical protein